MDIFYISDVSFEGLRFKNEILMTIFGGYFTVYSDGYRFPFFFPTDCRHHEVMVIVNSRWVVMRRANQ